MPESLKHVFPSQVVSIPLSRDNIKDWDSAWDRFKRIYRPRENVDIPTPTHYCQRCGILVPELGVRTQDEECDPLVVEGVMES